MLRTITCLFILVGLLPSVTAAQTDSVRLQRGYGTINFKGYVKDKRKTYDLNLRPGRKLRVSVTSRTGNVMFDAFYYPAKEENGTPFATDTKDWTGVVPQAARFSVDVFTTDSAMSSFKLTLQVLK